MKVACSLPDSCNDLPAAFEAGPRAQQLLRALKTTAAGSPAFTEAHTQCVSSEFLAAHSADAAEVTGAAANPKFEVTRAGLRAAIEHGSVPAFLLGHPMLVHGADTLPVYIATVIKGQETRHFRGLLERVDDVAANFSMHGALLAAMSPTELASALGRSGLGPELDGGLKTLAHVLLQRSSTHDVWSPLVAHIRGVLPHALPHETPLPNDVTAAGLDSVLKVEESSATAPDKVQQHVALASASTVAPEFPFDPYMYESDDEEQQNHGVHWLVTEALAKRIPDTTKFNFQGIPLDVKPLLHDPRRSGDRVARKLHDVFHPYLKHPQIKPDFVRWVLSTHDRRARLPTMVGASKPEYIDADGRATFQLAAYLMYVVRVLRLVDPEPTALGRLWRGKHLQYYYMTLRSAAGATYYCLTPWGAEFDVSTEVGRHGAIRRERACIAYCLSMEAKLNPFVEMLAATYACTTEY